MSDENVSKIQDVTKNLMAAPKTKLHGISIIIVFISLTYKYFTRATSG